MLSIKILYARDEDEEEEQLFCPPFSLLFLAELPLVLLFTDDDEGRWLIIRCARFP